MSAAPQKTKLFASDIDWITIGIYLAMVLFGWVNIYAAVFNEESASILDLSQRAGMQLIWMGVSAFLAISILLIDAKYWHMLSFPLYFAGVALMLIVLIFAREVNGARAWLEFGPVKVQPVEFMKFVTALALARHMSAYTFSIKNRRSIYHLALIIGVPILLILLQNDTGSALVFCSFFIVLYREGLGGTAYVVVLLLVFLFAISFLLEPSPILGLLLLLCVGVQALVNQNPRDSIQYLAWVMLLAIGWMIGTELLGWTSSPIVALLAAIGLTLPWVARYAIRRQLKNLWKFVLLFFGTTLFTQLVGYAFNHLLQTHQQKRILDLFGIEKDPSGWSYNVIQSKIAIGSGGLFGKGFLGGTQTRFSFVPEQSTDFIFCTVGEEWGFLGTTFVVVLFFLLIFRLMQMGERQKEPFGRIYCYCVAAIFFTHFAINVGMTVGLFPVVGIPLPFFSYGGSSLLAFTVLLFVAIRLDASQYDDTSRRLL